MLTQRLQDFIAELMTHLLKPPISVTYPGFYLLQDFVDDYGDNVVDKLVIAHRSLRPQRRHRKALRTELLVVHFGLLSRSRPYRGDTIVMDTVSEAPCRLRGHVGQNHNEARHNVSKGVVVIVQNNHAPVGVMLGDSVGDRFRYGCCGWHGD